MQYFCPACFAAIEWEHRTAPCRVCGVDGEQWEAARTFDERLIHALGHPNPTTRMMTIITLGNRRPVVAAAALVACAFRFPQDVVQALEIVNSISKLPDCPEKATALQRLTDHPSRPIRRAVSEYL